MGTRAQLLSCRRFSAGFFTKKSASTETKRVGLKCSVRDSAVGETPCNDVLVPGADVTIREQLVTQIILAIVSGDMVPGQRLPGTRQLAQRFRVHPKTVSAGYRQLQVSGHGRIIYRK
jgi:hypothetical protein